MSRSGYSDCCDDQWGLIRWRGAVASAIRGKRGQAFLREALAALDALPEPELVAGDLRRDGAVCTLGAVGVARGTPMETVDPDDHEAVAALFGLPHAMACEIMWMNDEAEWRQETPRGRWERMRRWIVQNLRGDLPSAKLGPSTPPMTAQPAHTSHAAPRP